METKDESKTKEQFDEFKELRDVKEFNCWLFTWNNKTVRNQKRSEYDLLKSKLDHELDMFELKIKYENMDIKKNK